MYIHIIQYSLIYGLQSCWQSENVESSLQWLYKPPVSKMLEILTWKNSGEPVGIWLGCLGHASVEKGSFKNHLGGKTKKKQKSTPKTTSEMCNLVCWRKKLYMVVPLCSLSSVLKMDANKHKFGSTLSISSFFSKFPWPKKQEVAKAKICVLPEVEGP